MATQFPILVALSGKAGSGKSAISEVLCGDELGFIRIKFSTPLKDMLRSLLLNAGVPEGDLEDYIEGDLKEVPTPLLKGKSPRDLMITLGTEWGRDLVHADFWVHLWSQRVRVLMGLGYSVVVDDLRFPNEAQLVREMDGVIIRVDRDSFKQVDHISESYSPNPDYVVDNNGSLYNTVRQVVTALNL